MTAVTKKPDVFAPLLAAMQAAYEDEIHRLVEVLRPRILAGEFSGSTQPTDDVRYLQLEKDLEKTHPWLSTERGRLAVVACSRWLVAAEKARTDPKTGKKLDIGWGGDFADVLASECMSHDILAVAAARGWVKPMRYLGNPEPYALKVA